VSKFPAYRVADFFCLFLFALQVSVTVFLSRLGAPRFLVNMPGAILPRAIRYRASNMYLLHFGGLR
jgi:hypothetical protein